LGIAKQTRAVTSRQHLLLYEPRCEGHHLGWLRFITEDLLAAGWQLTLAVDLRPENSPLVQGQLAEFLPDIRLINAYDSNGQRHGDGKMGSITHCLRESGAANVFLCEFDEVASRCWRRATFGFFPPAELRGRMGGIYYRPRFIRAPGWSPDRWLKQPGFCRIIREGWLRQLLLTDESLVQELKARFPGAPIFSLPDPCPTGYDGATGPARQALGLPADKTIFLFYGGGYRRKGLHLAVRAMQDLPANIPAFLLCAGRQNPTGETGEGLDRLIRQGRACLINCYVSEAEEKNLFAACDSVLLPYLNHFGSSGVFSLAMAAGKPVVVSDEQLLGRLTREHGLGLLFPSGNVRALSECIRQTTGLSPNEISRFSIAARQYARRYSRETYRRTLWKSLNVVTA
jgi:glycosyltransferase involved in cell wall biosynthesis